MSFRWRRTSFYHPSRHSFSRRFQNNAVRSDIPDSAVSSNRFRYRRVNFNYSMTSTSARPVTPNRSPNGQTSSSRSNMFRTVSTRTIKRTAYVAHSSKSIFKYRSRSWIVNKSKSKSSSRALTPNNPFVFHKSRRNVISPAHPYRLSVKRAISMNRRFVWLICQDYVKTGTCESADNCPLRHDSSYLRICPRFLQNICLLGEQKCPLAHVLDPCRIPQCIYFAKDTCSRSSCNFLHIKYPQGTPACQDFLTGRCEKGSCCKKRHIWRGDFDANKNEKSKSVSQYAIKSEDIAKESEQLGSLRNAKIVPDFIPFHISDD